METFVHVYECEKCILTFAVEQEFEDQTAVTCPVCHSEESIRDVGGGILVVRYNTEVDE